MNTAQNTHISSNSHIDYTDCAKRTPSKTGYSLTVLSFPHKYSIILSSIIFAACEATVLQPAANPNDANISQAMPMNLDAGAPKDATIVDAHSLDVGFMDAQIMRDAAALDAGFADADPIDLGFIEDAAFMDASTPDAGFLDAQVPDSGNPIAPNLSLSPGISTRQIGNTTGGNAYADACGIDAALVGFAGALDSRGWHGQIQSLCAKIFVTQTPPYRVYTGAVLAGATRGRFGNSPWTRSCPSDQVIVGYDSRSGALVDSLTFRCAPVTINGTTGAYQAVIGAISNLPSVGGSSGSSFGVTDCPAGQIATTLNVRAGDNVDAFGLGCSIVNAN